MPSAKRAARSRMRSTAAKTTNKIKAMGEGVPCLTLTEAQWQTRVIALAKSYGWRVFHPPDNVPRARLSVAERALKAAPSMSGRQLLELLRRSERGQNVEAGFPDLTLVRGPIPHETVGELLFAELKTETGRLGPGQAEWAADLEAVAGAVAMLPRAGALIRPSVEVHLWRPSQEHEVHDRLARGRVRIEPSWYLAPAFDA